MPIDMQNPDWDGICSAVLYIIRNYPLTILLCCLLCFIAGLLISLILTLVMRKYKAFSRVPKHYNWLVKLYIPAIFIINGIISLQLGLFWGSYKALNKDSFSISSQIYSSGVGSVFKDQKAKAEFVAGVRTVVSEISRNNENAKIKITDLVKAYDTEYGIINQPKNRTASWLMNRYGDRINTVVVLDPDDIENSIVKKLQNLLLMILKSQFKTMAGSLMMLWFILMMIPWLEFWMYTYAIKRITKRNNQIK